MFIFEREREPTWEGQRERERERERERIPSRLLTGRAESNAGLKLTNREIMTLAEVRRLTD